MKTEKRKHTTDDGPQKKRRRSEENPTTAKLTERSEDGNENKEPSKVSERRPQKSVLVKEQPLFPRGGAGVLTPIERKQIHARAVRDAEKEQEAGPDLFGPEDGMQGVSTDDEDLKVELSVSKPKQKSSKKSTDQSKTEHRERGTRIGGLSFKRIAVGSLVLGRITSISSRDLTVALPNDLSGYVPITAVSKHLTAKIEKLLKVEGSNSQRENEDDEDVILEDYFKIGEYLRVAVTSTGSNGETSSSRKRLELSLDPSQVNVGIDKSDLVIGCMVQVSVASTEDHGLVVDIGIEDNSVRGFVPASTLPESNIISEIKEGRVLLCQVTNVGSNGKVVKLCADPAKWTVMRTAPNVGCFLPGALTEVLITEIQDAGIAGKVMGMLDATADVVHSSSYLDKAAIATKFQLGKKIKGRVLCNFPTSDETRVGFSVLDHVINLEKEQLTPSDAISSTVSDAVVCRVEPGLGIYLDLGAERHGFAHISRLSDKKVDSVAETTGAYKVGSQHRARILDFNPVDNLFAVSLQESVLQRAYLRLEDVTAGDVVRVTIEKLLLGGSGIKGVVVKLVDGITGLVAAEHLADVALQHPEKKFREGAHVKARVLSVDASQRRISLTFKKTLVNSDSRIWKQFTDIEVGDSSLGTLVKVDAGGALVQFYGTVKGFLPVAEMSEAYIKDAREHFRIGQVVTVNAISVDTQQHRLTLSCREVKIQSDSVDSTLADLQPGTFVSGTVFEKSEDDVQLRLPESDAIARLTLDQISDGSLKKRQSTLSKLRVGQKLENLLVLHVQAKRRLVSLSNRQSLLKAAQAGTLLKSLGELEIGREVTGYVTNITSDGVFISFASQISGLMTSHNVPVNMENQADFGYSRLQTVAAKISHIDYKGASPRFWLTTRDPSLKAATKLELPSAAFSSALTDAVDPEIMTENDLTVDRVTKARVTSVKETQLNVDLAKDIQGRIDVSEIFDKWEDIKDRKKPLRQFSVKQELDVKVLGAHDTRNHRFLPLSHRTSKNTVYELSAKPSFVREGKKAVGYDDMKTGSSWIAFVNNVGHNYLWVTISPAVRGRIKAVDVADDLSLAANLEGNFPIGAALRVKVLSCDPDKGRLDLSAKTGENGNSLTMKDLSPGLILPGRITKISDRQILIQLNDDLVGAVDLMDIADDYSEANPARYQKNEVVRVCVTNVDAPNKKVSLSLRPSRVLSSSIKVTDPEVTTSTALNANDIYRGFIRNVDDKGVFVMLGHGVTAFIRVGNLSDEYLKEWKDSFQRDQLVQGKIISVDKKAGRIQMSLKKSVLDKDYVPPLTFNDIAVGDIVTGKVAKVEEFGVFIVVDNSENVRGLCHRSEIAAPRIPDARKLFNEGDAVKAKVLKVEPAKRRVNFGMKAAYFMNDTGDDEASEVASERPLDNDGDVDGGAAILNDLDTQASGDENAIDAFSEDKDADDGEDSDDDPSPAAGTGLGLKVGGFDWYGVSAPSSSTKRGATPDTEDDQNTEKKKRKKKPQIQIDRTGDLDANGPQSGDDYERLLLGEPDSSLLWLQYMAFHIELGDVDQARQIGERALKSIGLGQDAEKMNVWVALLNLESVYGDEESVEGTFQRACEYNDAQEMYSRLTSIYIQSGKPAKADDMFQQMLKKFTQDPKIWINYATYLFDTVGESDRARYLLPRALQILPKFTHLDLTSKFAQLEFKSSAGLAERGRTIFEGLVNSFPKRIDLYNVLLDLETKLNDKEQIRGLFERIFTRKLKPKQAKYFFKRWLTFEEKEGDERKIEDVKARAATWIKDAGKE